MQERNPFGQPELAMIKQFKKGNTSQKMQNKMMATCEKSAMSLKQIVELENNVRTKLQATTQRLKRYTKRSSQFQQNKLFADDQKKFTEKSIKIRFK